jgi:hypothetical protein
VGFVFVGSTCPFPIFLIQMRLVIENCFDETDFFVQGKPLSQLSK